MSDNENYFDMMVAKRIMGLYVLVLDLHITCSFKTVAFIGNYENKVAYYHYKASLFPSCIGDYFHRSTDWQINVYSGYEELYTRQSLQEEFHNYFIQ